MPMSPLQPRVRHIIMLTTPVRQLLLVCAFFVPLLCRCLPAEADDASEVREALAALTSRVAELEKQLLNVRIQCNECSLQLLSAQRQTRGVGAQTPPASSAVRKAVTERMAISIPRAEIEASQQNLPKVLSEARAVPYFRNGTTVGMRLFAIRSTGIYKKLGFQNGDILLSVDGAPTTTPEEVLRLPIFTTSDKSKTVIVLERFASDIELTVTITDTPARVPSSPGPSPVPEPADVTLKK